MKKTFLAMLMAGGTLSMFAQTTTTTGTTTQGSTGTTTQGTTGTTQGTMGTTTGTMQQSTGTTGDPSSTMGTMNNGTMNSGTNTGANGSWNGVASNPSTSWAPEGTVSNNWNSYGIWNNGGNMNNTTGMNGTASTGNNGMNNMNGSMNNTNGSMNSTGSYNAYSGTAVAGLPQNVQMRFSQDFPTGVNNAYSWNQYGDWFHTHYASNGRLMQYFYNTRGDGYALALPVIQTYVPENIISSALSKYGSSLYSIAMVKTNSGSDAYQIGLIRGGQVQMQYLNESGVSVADVWRVDSLDNGGMMNSTQSNAAMGSGSTMNGSSMSNSSDMNSNTSSQWNNGQSATGTKSKMKIEHADGSETKIKTKDGKTKVKTKPATSDMNNQDQ